MSSRAHPLPSIDGIRIVWQEQPEATNAEIPGFLAGLK